MGKEYRLASGYGSHMEKRWEVQEKYFYYDGNGERVEAWHMVYHSTSKENCERVLEKYRSDPPVKKPSISIEDTLELWN